MTEDLDVTRLRLKSILATRNTKIAEAPLEASNSPKDAFYRFEKDADIVAHRNLLQLLETSDIDNPYFNIHEGSAAAMSRINGSDYINFSSYNYLGLSGHARVSAAAIEEIGQSGTSVSASRVASGERRVQQRLEQKLAAAYEVEASLTFVSGHATNVTVIGHLFGPGDLILHDDLAHNSCLQGAILSGAKRMSFPHNDSDALDQILRTHRRNFKRVLIFVEGIYSMDGDFPDLHRMIELRNKYRTYLMVDEAHSFGVLGETGLGLREHFGVKGSDVDLWMGTLSKSLASCGGYIAGPDILVSYLKYTAPGFLYSVGITPPNARAAEEALDIIREGGDRVANLRDRANYFRKQAKARGLDTGLSMDGSAVVPIILGASEKALRTGDAVFKQGINVQAVLFPTVKENEARFRFFLCSEHTEEQIDKTIDTVVDVVRAL
jgi:8-amino-7-oxononanoate synthase